MIHHIALTVAALVVGPLALASPVPDPDPHRTHIKIHLPYDVHTIHHHHVEKVPVIHELPVIREVPVLKPYPVIKTVPIVKTVHVPIVNTIAVEKPVIVPVVHDHLSVSHWH